MESLIVSPLLQVIFDHLGSSILNDVHTSRDFKKEMKKLQERLPVIQTVMEDAEQRQREDQKIKIWLTKLRDIAYDAEDLIDELSTLVLRRQLAKTHFLPLEAFSYSKAFKKSVEQYGYADYFKKFVVRPTMKKVRLSLESIPSYFKMSRKLKDIRERLDYIAKEMSSFQFKEVVLHRVSDAKERREIGPYIEESEVYGRKEDMEKIVEMLLSSNTIVRVIPIFGIGGIGKTALAQLAYNDERITRHFDLKMWVSVYDNFNSRKLITEILEYATKKKCEASQMGVLQFQLRESLCGKRYLLVLDDVWNDDQDEWDKMKNLLRGGADGSKIIVTTRSKKVASIMSTTPPYLLETLSKDDYWNLFKQRAFAEGEEDDFPNLLPIGKQIVDKCKGVPFAAKILGSLMRFKREEREWVRVQGSELWNLDGGDNRILSVLRLSFNHLPAHLKRCFAYCAVFPRNYDIDKKKLIQQWIAEGLIQISADGYPADLKRSPMLEVIGNEYFNDLLRMTFFQGVTTCDDSDMMEFKMHDLIYDLAKSVAGNECLTMGNNNMQNRGKSVVCDALAKTRHALVDCNSMSDLIPEGLFEARRLHTLNLLSSGDVSQEALRNIFSSFRHLKNLNLSGCGIERLHRSIGDLIYLRYLDLSNTPIETLPESIAHLCNLQTLDLSGCSALLVLPRETIELGNLVHLNIKDCARLTCLPAFIGFLKNLQTLPVFFVGHTYAEGLLQLSRLSYLQGELKIKHLENHIPLEFRLDFIKSLRLHLLGLSWGDDEEGGKGNRDTSRQTRQTARNNRVDGDFLISCLQPNDSIRRLFINGYPGTEFPRWMNLDTLSNLTHLELINCRTCESLPTLGQLPVLKVLNIQGMDSVMNIGGEFFGEGRSLFPSLKELSLRDFPKLKFWGSMDSTEAFSCLNRLAIIRCPFLITIPWFPSLQHLEMRDCSPVILRSAAELRSLSTLVIDSFPDLLDVPYALAENNSLLLSLTVLSCPKIRSMPTNLGKLTALKSLKIGWCEELYKLSRGLTKLTALETLEIIECPSLISVPGESMKGLSSLRSLSIENCSSLASLPMVTQGTNTLERLTIMYCLNLAHLPDLQHLSALKSLTILSCPELESLQEGLQHVITLQNLEIRSCPKLIELPEWIMYLVSLRSLAISDCQNIKCLPQGLQHLSRLQHLSIRDCSDLEVRCQKSGGDDWQKISHIPHIYVGSSALQQRHDTAASSSRS